MIELNISWTTSFELVGDVGHFQRTSQSPEKNQLETTKTNRNEIGFTFGDHDGKLHYRQMIWQHHDT